MRVFILMISLAFLAPAANGHDGGHDRGQPQNHSGYDCHMAKDGYLHCHIGND